MQFQKYGDYPVGDFTGIPDINIPLYTIKEGDITLPISLSYHASGIKPTDVNGFVGLGWSLNAGGKISRTIMDEADDAAAPTSPFYTASQLSGYTYSQLPAIMTPLEEYKDTEPDIFSYSFENSQGKFVLKRDAARTPLLMPYKPLKIAGHMATTGAQRIDYFNIVDENGFQYKFYQSEYPSGTSIASPTGWSIERITSPVDSSNHLDFAYATGPIERMSKRIDMFIGDDDLISNLLCRSCWGQTTVCRPVVDYLEYGAPSVYRNDYNIDYPGMINKEITFRSGRVRFVQNTTTKMLDSIIIYNANNVKQRSIALQYLQRSSNRVLLKVIKFYDGNNRFINQYGLSYNSEGSSMPNTEQASTDFWGYYNGLLGDNPSYTLLPNWQFFFETWGTRNIGSNSRQTNEGLMKTFVLEQITYPTGGSTFFDYEANQYRGVGINGYSGKLVGGLRIKQIISYTEQNQVAQTKTYKYGTIQEPESGYGIMDVYPGKELFSYSQRVYFPSADPVYPWDSYRRIFFSSESFTDLCPHGSPVIYTSVTEYIGDGQKNIGKTINEYTYQEAELTQFKTNGDQDGHAVPILYRRYLKPCEEWKSGQNTNTTYFKNVNGVYSSVYSQTNDYQEVARENLQALHMDRFVVFTNDPCGNYTGIKDEAVFVRGEVIPGSVFNYGDYYLESGEKKLVSTTINENGLITATSYEYANSVHNLPTKKTRTNSKGENIITALKYPHDFVSTAPYNTMVNTRHIWSPVVEQTDYKNSTSTILSVIKTNYADWGNGIIAPATVEVTKGANSPETRLRFLSYDNRGNILSLSKENNVVTSYLWGYNKTLPVAEVTGASSSTISGLVNQNVLDSWTSTEQQVKSQLDNLRSGLTGTNALVNTYTYKPLVGLSSQTDPDGKPIFYEYDGLGRLQHIRDENQNILKKYSYAFLGLNEQGVTEAAPQWQATGITRPKSCPLNSNYTTGATQQQQKDINSTSLTYNQLRWVDQGTDGAGSPSDWQFTATPIRCKSVNGYYTGEQEREQVNLNPCSVSYNQTRWTVVGTNTTACPLPTSWTSEDRSGTYYSTACPSGQMPNPIIVSVPAGMFTSTISLMDANQKAVNYAQNYANQHGTCYAPPATLTFTNNANTQTFDVYLTNLSTGQSYSYHTTQQNQTLGDVPAGNYNIQVVPGIDASYSFSVGCGHTSTGQTANFSNVAISYDCNTIVVDTF
jgi:YD repeat-containing protein